MMSWLTTSVVPVRSQTDCQPWTVMFVFKQWECPTVDVVPVLPPLYHSSPRHHLHHRLHKAAEGWISPEEVGVFHRRDKRLLLTNQIIHRPRDHAPRSLLLSPSHFTGRVRSDVTKSRRTEPEDSALLHLLSVSPLHPPLLTPPPSGVTYVEWAGPHVQRQKGVWPALLPHQRHRGAWLRPAINRERRETTPVQHVFGPVCPAQLCFDMCPVSPVQLIKDLHPGLSSRLSTKFTLLTNYRRKKRRTTVGGVTYGQALLFREKTRTDDSAQRDRTGEEKEDEEDGGEKGGKDKRPVASTPVPGSPWCVVWTADDRVFFFNPTMHLSVWETPGDLTGRDISRIIEDPPHKRKKTPGLYLSVCLYLCLSVCLPVSISVCLSVYLSLSPFVCLCLHNNDKIFVTDRSSSCQSPGLHGDKEAEDECDSKRSRLEEPMSLVPRPGKIQLLPLELRTSHFREMMLERGVSAFSSWDKELHKMVFDPRYLLLTSHQRKQVFDEFVKSRMKDEHREKKSKQQKAREEFRRLLEEAKITSRSTFKEFCARYRGDQRFNVVNRKKEQEVLFSHYITSLKKRDKENRARLRKMR
ncbi:transcription elongation regulator 1 isoform X1 [Solea senegalensis]|uniref:Transcription elongation regulator 1 isoform X1 n=1 Tax=Solea senegalensis TaxID=28829 RepID=A0AAV6RMM2_SOLSE|nr:transcription elongation regulator 1 isoform X1 [Solea senegalensis]